MNRKGDVTDSITLIFWLFVIALFIIVVIYAFNFIFSELAISPLGDDNSTLAAINTSQSIVVSTIPTTYFIILFGLLMGLLVSSFMIRMHPIFIPVYIFMAVGSILASVVLGNAWGNIMDVEFFSDTIALNSYLGAIDTIMRHSVLITTGAFILSLIITFAKPVQQGGAAPY